MTPINGLDPLARPVLRTQSDERLVALAREGREAAFEEIVRRYRPALVAFAAAYAPAAAEDVVQDSLVRSWRTLRESTAEIVLRPWLYTIVRNRALNARRDARDHAELDENYDGVRQPTDIILTKEELGRAVASVRALPEAQREALVRSALDGRAHDQIAAELGTSVGSVRQLIYRARSTLRHAAGFIVPLPLLRALVETDAAQDGVAAASGGAAAAAGTVAVVGGGSAAAKGLAVVAAVIAATGSGIAIERAVDDGGRGGSDGQRRSAATTASTQGDASGGSSSGPGRGGQSGPGGGGSGSDDGDGGSGRDGTDDGDERGGEGSPGDDGDDDSGEGGGSSSGPGDGDDAIELDDDGDDRSPSGSGTSGSDSGSRSSGSGTSGSGTSGSDSSGSRTSGSGDDGDVDFETELYDDSSGPS